MTRCTTFALTLFLGAFTLLVQPTEAAAQESPIAIRDAWLREPVGDRPMTAGFAVVTNRGSAPRAIVGAATEVAGKVELHEMKMDGAMMRMSPVEKIDIPAGGSVELKPGGLHLMLFDLKRTPRAGETVQVTLTFDDGSKATVAAAVRRQEGMR